MILKATQPLTEMNSWNLPTDKARPVRKADNLTAISNSKSHYERQSVGQSVLVSGAHLGPATNFSFFLRFSFRQLRFVIL
jgi:hypothetical protein